MRTGHARVTNVELFFDLVFVFAVTQLSHRLLHDLTLAGALGTALLFLAMWWVWIFTAWATNWLDPDRTAVRLLLFAMMLAGLLFSISIPHAFAETGLIFAAAHAAMQLGRTLFAIWAVRASARMRQNFYRILVWLGAAALFWIAGGLAEGGWRAALWAAALAIEYAAPWAYFRVPGLGRSQIADWRVDGAHMAERCGLFVIIALGESIVVTGAAFGEIAWTPATLAAFATAFVGSVAMWWIYFHIGAERAAAHIGAAATPGRMARLGYTYLHMPIVAAIILGAVGDELVLQHPDGHADAKAIAVILGAPALYLAGNAGFKRLTARHTPLSHVAGLGLLAALLGVAWLCSPLGLAALATAVLVLVAGWEHVSLKVRAPRAA